MITSCASCAETKIGKAANNITIIISIAVILILHFILIPPHFYKKSINLIKSISAV